VIPLHRRLAALLALIALLAFISGAGLSAPSSIPAAVMLLLAVFAQPGEGAARRLEPLWRVAAVLLAGRAVVIVFLGHGDAVLPMVDLLLLLLCAESLRPRDGSGDARHFALTFALLIASAAYRPGPAFGVLFAAYVVCAVVTLLVGHLTRQAASHGLQPPAPRPAFLLRIALLSLVVLVSSMVVFLFFPRVSRAWATRTTPLPASAVIGFSDRVSIGDHGARLEPNPLVVLRVEFPQGRPPDLASLYWRGRSYNRFDGRTWSRLERAPSLATQPQRWPGPALDQLIYARPLADANVVFGLHPITGVSPQSRIHTLRTGSDDYVYVGDGDPTYRVRSRPQAPHPDSLRPVEMRYPPEVMAHLQLPPTSLRVLALADSFRSHAVSVYDQAAEIERWLHTFRYTLDLPGTAQQATLDHFLFVRRAGHCEYFSTAMAVLLRAGGVPARNVNGFLGGEWNEFGGFLTVTQNNAHSWVEVWFPGWGWVPFDPTPPGASAAAGVGMARSFSSLRALFAGLEHRWGKWVLDYDVGTQTALLRRTTAPIARSVDAQRDNDGGLPWPLIAVAVALSGAVVLFAQARFPVRRGRPPAVRAYLRLRRAYERAGLLSAADSTPLRFAAAVTGMPGGEPAQRAVSVYVRARFGGRELDADELIQLRRDVAAARRELRRRASAQSANGSDDTGNDGRSDGGGLRSFG
jgi:protein-glutamine gamma-glutamyltransferase